MSSAPPPATILLVEDEPIVRMATAWQLEMAGFRVIEAGNAAEALAILEATAEVRVIVTDIDMPGDMDGIRLAHAVRGRWPPVRIVIVSGRRAAEARDLPDQALFFAKPFDIGSLTKVLHRLSI